jgi:hypothetical protein
VTTKALIFLWIVVVWVAVSVVMMWPPICLPVVGPSISSCINNLRQIDGAKQQYMIETGRTNGPVEVAAINHYLGRGGAEPVVTCPSGGTYTYGDLEVPPICTVTNSTPGVKERVGLFRWRWKAMPSRYPHKLPY